MRLARAFVPRIKICCLVSFAAQSHIPLCYRSDTFSNPSSPGIACTSTLVRVRLASARRLRFQRAAPSRTSTRVRDGAAPSRTGSQNRCEMAQRRVAHGALFLACWTFFGSSFRFFVHPARPMPARRHLSPGWLSLCITVHLDFDHRRPPYSTTLPHQSLAFRLKASLCVPSGPVFKPCLAA